MDAHAYLKSQGWRGTGHSLHPDSDETGLKHHLLIKRNDDGRGLGLKKADHKAEAWWLNAFDQALKGIDVSKDAKGGMKQTLRDGGQLAKITSKGLTKYTGSRGLYNSFVKGGVMGGSVGVDEPIKPGITLGGSGKKEAGNNKSERKTQLATPPDSGAATPTLNDDDDSSSSSEDDGDVQKVAKTKRKAAKKERKQQKITEKAERRARREAKKPDTVGKPGQDDKRALQKAAKKAEKKAAKALMKASETREQRKARRDVRRNRKEEKRKIAALR